MATQTPLSIAAYSAYLANQEESFDRSVDYVFDGVGIQVRNGNEVAWMSDWCKCDAFVDAGLFTSKFYRQHMGHVDYFVAGLPGESGWPWFYQQ